VSLQRRRLTQCQFEPYDLKRPCAEPKSAKQAPLFDARGALACTVFDVSVEDALGEVVLSSHVVWLLRGAAARLPPRSGSRRG
jgi:hypothetical protein